MKKDIELRKASGSIWITGNPSLLQRKAWNVLLFKAFNLLATKEKHEISLVELADLAGYESKDIATFKDTLGGLLTCTVEWDILNKKGNQEWSKSTLLSGVKIEHGIIEYAYSPFLRERLSDPEQFAKLNLQIQSRFESKYVLALWELCCDRYKVHSTGEIEIDKFKELLGATSVSYKTFKIFNQKVLTPAIKEINEKSEFLISVEFQKKKKRVVSVKILIDEKKAVISTKPLSEAKSITQPELPINPTELAAAKKKLADSGINLPNLIANLAGRSQPTKEGTSS